jgi:hypothetical protein
MIHVSQLRQSTLGRACLPLATSMALRLAVNLHPPNSAGSSAQHLLALLPPKPLHAPTAQGDRCCRERDVAHRGTAEPLWRTYHIGVKLGIECTIYARVTTDALSPDCPASEPILRLPHSVCQAMSGMSSLEECQYRCPSVQSTFFTASQQGRGLGWDGARTVCRHQRSSLRPPP